jgi:hypothetical protein
MLLTIVNWGALACTLFFFLSPWQASCNFCASFIRLQHPFRAADHRNRASDEEMRQRKLVLVSLDSRCACRAFASALLKELDRPYRTELLIAGNCSLWAVYCWLRRLYMPGFATNFIGTSLSGPSSFEQPGTACLARREHAHENAFEFAA